LAADPIGHSTAVPVPTNRTKARLAAGELCVGTMLVEIRQPGIMIMLANAGFDFVLVDNEHGPFPVDTIAELCRAARSEGVTPIVRIPELPTPTGTRSTQAAGIMLWSSSGPRECVRYEVRAGRTSRRAGPGYTGSGGPLVETPPR
jgi:hypothetical protein